MVYKVLLVCGDFVCGVEVSNVVATVHSGVCSSASCEFDFVAQDSGHRVFEHLLDTSGVWLSLPSVEVCASVC